MRCMYVVEEVASFRGLGQLMGLARNKRTLEFYRPELLVAYAETETNSKLFYMYLKYISKVLQGSLKGKESTCRQSK